MTEIVVYCPKTNVLTSCFYAWELIARLRLGFEIIGEL